MRTSRDRRRIRKQTRKRKLRRLRKRLENTTDSAERRRLMAKIRRISPTAPLPEE